MAKIDGVDIYDGQSFSYVKTISINNYSVAKIVFLHDGKKAYTGHPGTGLMSSINAMSDTYIKTLDNMHYSGGMAGSKESTMLYVAAPIGINVLNTETGLMKESIAPGIVYGNIATNPHHPYAAAISTWPYSQSTMEILNTITNKFIGSYSLNDDACNVEVDRYGICYIGNERTSLVTILKFKQF